MLKKFASFVVEHRNIILIVMIIITVINAVLMLQVDINMDMTKYLPDSSDMKQGMDIMNEEFPDNMTSQTIRVMFTDLKDVEKAIVKEKLENISFVDEVTYDADSPDYNKDNHTLYIINTSAEYKTPSMKKIEYALDNDFKDYNLVWKNDDVGTPEIPQGLLLLAIGIMLAILFVMCGSWIEPILFLIGIGFAVVINKGTNIFQGTVSYTTESIAAILQLVLSMDYSIILINRYKQEREKCSDIKEAMKTAICNAFPSITSSGLTTVAGLLVLVSMSFKIGKDVGIVLAKGVALSMFAVLVIMPGIFIICDKLIKKTAKKEPHLPMGWLANFSVKFHWVIAGVFVLLMVGAFILQQKTEIVYTLDYEDKVADVFTPDNRLVLIYHNNDEEFATIIAGGLANDENVKSVMAIGTIMDSELFAPYRDSDSIEAKIAKEVVKSQLVGEHYSRMIIDTTYELESEETFEFLKNITALLKQHFSHKFYFIGNSAMSYEMSQSFGGELLFITILTAVVIYLIVAITTRSFIIPLILVAVVQTGVYVTISSIGIRGNSIYFLALLMVQCILMGSTIDYGILFTNYFVEKRKKLDIKDAIKQAYEGAIHTIATSGLILVMVTAIVGKGFKDPTIEAIVNTISIGSFIVLVIIVFLLPGVIVSLDKLIVHNEYVDY